MGQRVYGSSGVIQAGSIEGSIIVQIVEGIRTPDDIEGSIIIIQEHLDSLAKRRGLLEVRPLLVVAVTAFILFAQETSIQYGAILYTTAALLMLCGWQLTALIRRVDVEIDATRTFLVELYKVSLHQRLGDR
ncbi:MAG: hypothetical protein RBR06_06255 [Desulfuromonadaceae bacterium]|nr:hypothetical protein [Desulfuromonadaceae bacterium]